ncbi:XRE family transcriptional regulator [Methylobacterium sp. V23]|nr:XRE family transcriptional regulator [Methylobacterium sp. V23]
MRPSSVADKGSAPRAFSSRHFLKLIEETGKVGFWSADLRAERMDVSPGLYRILGLDPSEEMTFGFGLDMIHPDDHAAHGDQIAVLRSGQPVNREFRIIRPDRTQRWLLHQAEVILGPDGKPSLGMGVVFDVTTQHDTMNALMQRHDRLNALVAATATVFWINKANGEPSEMPQWMELTGQSHAQMQGLGWLDAIHPEDQPRTRAAWMTAVEHAAPYNTDYRVLCADGIYRWFNARGAPVFNKDGSVREWVGVCLNVAGRNRYGSSETSVRSNAIRDPSAAPLPGEELPTPGQIRAARAFVGLSKEDLSRLANVSVSTINRLEDPNSPIRTRSETAIAVRRALEKAGVEFTFEDGAKPGVREV